MFRHGSVAVIGAGSAGGSLANVLATCTNVARVELLEKGPRIAGVASASHANSQTKHDSSIETNYSLEKAREVKPKADMLERYAVRRGLTGRAIHAQQKMVLGVGGEEAEFLRKRYEAFKDLHPDLELFDRARLKSIEPAVVFAADGRERPEEILGMGMASDLTAVDFAAITESLVAGAVAAGGAEVNVHLNARVTGIRRRGDIFEIVTPDKTLGADFVVVNAGAYSLLMAHRMGYGTHLACVPIAGGFYMANKRILNGKVYTVQNPKLPFAALHGDPDILAGGRTRFGPTAFMKPKLEYQRGLETFADAVRSMNLDWSVISVLGGMMFDPDIRAFVVDNALYETPWYGKHRLAGDLRKIVPALQAGDIEYAEGFGGVRPQIIDKTARKLLLGEASIDTGDGLLFNMTPSPGATSCIGNAARDAKIIAAKLGLSFDEERFAEEF